MNFRRCLAIIAPNPQEKLSMLSQIAEEHGMAFDVDKFSSDFINQTKAVLQEPDSSSGNNLEVVTGERCV